MTAYRDGISFCSDENVLKLDSDSGCMTLNVLKIIELYVHFKRVNLWYMRYSDQNFYIGFFAVSR